MRHGDFRLCVVKSCACPSAENVIRPHGVHQHEGFALHRVGRRVRLSFGQRAAVEVIADGIGADSPLGKQLNIGALYRGEVLHDLAVGVGHIAVARRGPAVEAVARAGEGVGGQGPCSVVGEGLCCHRALAAVGVEADGVGDGSPLGPELLVARGACSNGGHGIARQPLVGVPSAEGVALAGGRGQDDVWALDGVGLVVAVRHGAIVHFVGDGKYDAFEVVLGGGRHRFAADGRNIAISERAVVDVASAVLHALALGHLHGAGLSQ